MYNVHILNELSTENINYLICHLVRIKANFFQIHKLGNTNDIHEMGNKIVALTERKNDSDWCAEKKCDFI